MKRYILLIIFSAGLFITFYSGYYVCINNLQNNLVKEAVSTENYDFFLKFNSKYNDDAIYQDNNIMINEIYLEEYKSYGLNIIFVNLSSEDITSDKLSIVIEGSEKNVTIPYLSNAYITQGIIVTQILNYQLEELKIINSIKVLSNNENLHKSTLQIECNNLFKNNNYSLGYTQEDINSIFSVKEYTELFKMLAKYITGCFIVFCVLIMFKFVNRNR